MACRVTKQWRDGYRGFLEEAYGYTDSRPNDITPNDSKPNDIKPNDIYYIAECDIKPNDTKPNGINPNATLSRMTIG